MTITDDFDEKLKALQLVIASLGGLLGSIIGYYFGESAARSQKPIITTEEETIQNESESTDGEIANAPPFNKN